MIYDKNKINEIIIQSKLNKINDDTFDWFYLSDNPNSFQTLFTSGIPITFLKMFFN
jgi:hypothetical protein